jgi:hypothetical protein
MPTNLKGIILASVILISYAGLLALSVIDENSRPVFQKVAEMSIAAYLGYLIPNK